MLAVSFSFADD